MSNPLSRKAEAELTEKGRRILAIWTTTEQRLEQLAASGEQSKEQRRLAMLYDQCSHFYWGLPYSGPEPELLENELATFQEQRTSA